MENKIVVMGKIEFEPVNHTKKHNHQASWKRIAMVLIAGDITEYYCWYIERRYNLKLNKPLRGGHISFINDSLKDMTLNGTRTLDEVNALWEEVKNKWDGQEIPIMLSLEPRFDKTHWWLNIPYEYRDKLHGIRGELGLGNPYYGLHMSLGYSNERNLSHHGYITRGIKNGLIT